MTSLQFLFVLLYLWNSVEICLSYFTVPLPLESEHLDFSQLVSCGLDWPETWVFGLVPVSVASGARYRLMFMPFFQPSIGFSHMNLDLMGPLPSGHGFIYLLTMIDRTTQWPEVAPLSSITAESCVRTFLFSWVARFGVPLVLTSDQGS